MLPRTPGTAERGYKKLKFDGPVGATGVEASSFLDLDGGRGGGGGEEEGDDGGDELGNG